MFRMHTPSLLAVSLLLWSHSVLAKPMTAAEVMEVVEQANEEGAFMELTQWGTTTTYSGRTLAGFLKANGIVREVIRLTNECGEDLILVVETFHYKGQTLVYFVGEPGITSIDLVDDPDGCPGEKSDEPISPDDSDGCPDPEDEV